MAEETTPAAGSGAAGAPGARGSGKPSRRLRWALVLSLALNLLIVGVIAGAVVNARRRPRAPTVADVGFGPFTQALSPEDRRALRDAFVGRLPEMRDARRAMRAELQALVDALRAETWNEAATVAAFESLRSRTEERIAVGQDLLIARIAAMSPAERAAFADRLENLMRRPMMDRRP